MHLAALHIYPVKSCRGLSVASAEVDAHGLVGDRRFMVVHTADGLFLTQRTHPRMALIETELTADAEGFIRFISAQSGRHSLSLAHHRETLAGFHLGQPYEQTSHNCSLVWWQK